MPVAQMGTNKACHLVTPAIEMYGPARSGAAQSRESGHIVKRPELCLRTKSVRDLPYSSEDDSPIPGHSIVTDCCPWYELLPPVEAGGIVGSRKQNIPETEHSEGYTQ